jgi:hypothetical protein
MIPIRVFRATSFRDSSSRHPLLFKTLNKSDLFLKPVVVFLRYAISQNIIKKWDFSDIFQVIFPCVWWSLILPAARLGNEGNSL